MADKKEIEKIMLVEVPTQTAVMVKLPEEEQPVSMEEALVKIMNSIRNIENNLIG